MFKLAVRVKSVVMPTANLGTSNILQLLHERMGHQSKQHVRNIAEREFNMKLQLDSELCEGCIYGKAQRKPFKSRDKYRATVPGELIHSDVCGPWVPSGQKKEYFVLFKDDYTRFRQIYFIQKKSEVPEKLCQFILEAKAQGHVIKQLRSDGGGEFDSAEMRAILAQHGIQQVIGMPYSSQQNGSAERDNRTIVESARSMIHAVPGDDLPKYLWAEFMSTAAYILNRTGKSSVCDKSPSELWYGRKPAIKHLRVIGTTVYAKVPDQRRQGKMGRKALKCILIGYQNDDGYRLYNRETNQVVLSRDVTFQEETVITSSRDVFLPAVPDSSDVGVRDVGVQSDDCSARDHKCDDKLHKLDNQLRKLDVVPDDVSESSESEEDDHSHHVPQRSVPSTSSTEQRVLRDRTTLKLPLRYQSDYAMSATASFQHDIVEPESFDDAVSDEHCDSWKRAMDAEMSSLNENQTWSLVDLPQGRKAIHNKWVYKVKTNPDGSVDKYKARLVIKGFSQRKGVDYSQTFSPVAKSSTIRSVIAVAASENMYLSQFDVSTAFLYGELEEDIYMVQPEGYADRSGRVCKLKRSLYGLKQAPRCWNDRFSTYLLSLGFSRSEADPCLFIRVNGDRKIIVALYVDDGLVASTHREDADQFITELEREFKITVKPASYFLGIEIDQRDDKSIKISQGAYTARVLDRFGMADSKAVSTPIIKDGDVIKDDSCEKESARDISLQSSCRSAHVSDDNDATRHCVCSRRRVKNIRQPDQQ